MTIVLRKDRKFDNSLGEALRRFLVENPDFSKDKGFRSDGSGGYEDIEKVAYYGRARELLST
ncbi:hypothetical protein H6503_04280 [Candidatus Woesearchaeota archaeon]|nr:hypothetical protein [Candidatus Woesearchaeota archaeon]